MTGLCSGPPGIPVAFRDGLSRLWLSSMPALAVPRSQPRGASAGGWAGTFLRGRGCGGSGRVGPGLLAHRLTGRPAAFPRWVWPSLWLKVTVPLRLDVPLLEGVRSEGNTKPGRLQRFQKRAVGFSRGPGSFDNEVFFECLILGMNLTGSSTQAKALPQDSRHMEDTSPACIRSSR